MSDSWFTDVEEVAYSFIEYLPTVGTLYSVKCAGIAYSERDWKSHWHAVANFSESAIRDAVLISGAAEPQTAVIIHTMTELLTTTMIAQLFKEHTPTYNVGPLPKDKSLGYVIVAGTRDRNRSEETLFKGKAKGVHQFHGAIFSGTLKDPKYALNGETIQLSLPQGFYENAPCQFTWKWTIDAYGVKNRPEITFGRLQIIHESGRHTGFKLKSRRGVGWRGYDFWGKIESTNKLSVTTHISGEVSFAMRLGIKQVKVKNKSNFSVTVVAVPFPKAGEVEHILGTIDPDATRSFLLTTAEDFKDGSMYKVKVQSGQNTKGHDASIWSFWENSDSQVEYSIRGTVEHPAIKYEKTSGIN